MSKRHRVAVVHCPDGFLRQRVLSRWATIAEAEAEIARIEREEDPQGVPRGDYGIDPPEDMI